MSDLEKSHLSLATIAVCALVLCGFVWWAASGYDGINARLDVLAKGQQDTHEWLAAMSSKVTTHDLELARIQQSLDSAKEASSTDRARDKKYQEGN